MTTTYISSNIVGDGPLFTYAAAGDELVVLAGGALLSTLGGAVSGASLADVQLHLFGTIVSHTGISFSAANPVVHIYQGGSYTSLDTVSGNTAIQLGSNNASLINEGAISAQRAIGVLGGSDTDIVNSGSISGASGVFMGLNGATGSTLLNSGTISANEIDDLTRNIRFNNGVMTEGGMTQITNLAGGQITAISGEGAGVLFAFSAGGSRLDNHGTITANHFAVSLGAVGEGQAGILVSNRGTISGVTGAYLGSVNADTVLNRGLLEGDVQTGSGNDRIDNRGGIIEGDIDFSIGNDVLDNRGGRIGGDILFGDGTDEFILGEAAEVADGGLGTQDLIDARTGAGGVIDLLEDRGTGLALGDVLTGFERVRGSASGADTIYGNSANNVLHGYGGADRIEGDSGADILYGGRGADTLTGGAGNETFGIINLGDIGDVITDFSSSGAGNDDRIAIRAASFGGGLVAGALDASTFQIRADNVAQDTNDRFIFRTTDRTLWFDVDGTGAGVAVMVADLQAGATLTASDFLLI